MLQNRQRPASAWRILLLHEETLNKYQQTATSINKQQQVSTNSNKYQQTATNINKQAHPPFTVDTPVFQ
jgi:hypothetical protein